MVRRSLLLLGLAGWLGGLSGCARAERPTGGPVPETPLSVVQVTPGDFAQVEPFGGPVRFLFDRPLSERLVRGSLRDAVVVSPQTGEVQVRASSRGIEVSMEGGFRDRTVYRVTLLPVLQDRFRNAMAAPVDLFFSTGPEFQPTLLAGYVEDRISGRPVRDARVDAVPVEGGATHTAVTDSLGVFAFRFLPANQYELWAFLDQNRNREPDFSEPQARVELRLEPADTVVVTELVLLAMDSTAARPERARLLDSLTVELEFDDYLDPASSSSEIVAAFRPEPSGTAFSAAGIFHVWEWEEERERRRRAPAVEPDSLAPPTTPPTTPPTIPPTIPQTALPTPLEVGAGAVQRQAPGPDVRPDRRLILILPAPLTPETTFTVGVANVRNINGIPDGRGEVTLRTPPAG